MVNTVNKEPAPFGVLLVAHRTAAGLTQEQLAARAGLSPDAVAALERGKRRTPRFATIGLLATALGLDTQERAQLIEAARGIGSMGRARTPERARTDSGAEREAEGAGRDQRRHPWWPKREVETTPLVDRASELDMIVRLLAGEGERVRLLTLTGPAGVGKTRLALAATARLAEQSLTLFRDAVVWGDLAPVRDPQDVLGAIGHTFGFTDSGFPPLDVRLRDFLRERALLLVLDNFEHVLPAAGLLADLLAACPRLVLLVTSRVPLALRWEQTLRIAPLPVPDLSAALPPLDTLLAVPAVELFVDRARASRVDFALSERYAPLVAQVAVELDGLPLALELAAARLDVLSLPTLARRLSDRLRLLALGGPDRPARQRSLEAAVGWSYDLLGEQERRLFRCLGVFAGRVTLDAVAGVAGDVAEAGIGGDVGSAGDEARAFNRLVALAEKSLLLPVLTGEEEDSEEGSAKVEEDEDLEPAFGMLGTVREYAQEQLVAAGELAAARRAHAHYFLALAERAEPELHGRDQRAWMFRLDREHDNLRVALRWLLDQDDEAEREAGLRLAGALGWYWWRRGYYAEGGRWLQEALARAPKADPGVRSRALVVAGPILMLRGDIAQSKAVLDEGLALAQQRQDPAGIAQALSYQGLRSAFSGEVAEAIRLLCASVELWEATGTPYGLGEALFWLGYATDATGDVATAAAHYTAALERLGAEGDVYLVGFVQSSFGVTEGRRGELSRAVEHVQAAVRISATMRDRWLLSYAAQAAVALVGAHPQPTQRARLLGAAEALAQATGATYGWEHLPGAEDVLGLRERLAREGQAELAAAYQEGRSLPFDAAAALALSLLEKVAQALPQSDAAADSAQQPMQRSQQTNPLTAREQEVLRLVAQGLSSKAIGQQLFLAPSTVNHHLTAIFNKLGVNTRAQAVAVAAQRSLV